MLNNFFRINFPYGLAKNENGEWMTFNRDYLPIGFNEDKNYDLEYFKSLPVYTKYKGLTQNNLAELAYSPKHIERNNEGEIIKIFFYSDGSIPVQVPQKKALWDSYFEKLKRLSKYERQK